MSTELETPKKTKTRRKTRKNSGARQKQSAEETINASMTETSTTDASLPQTNQRKRSHASSAADLTEDSNAFADTETAEADAQLILLRDLILGSYQERIAGLQDELTSTHQEMDGVLGKIDNLSERIDDKEALLNTISPIIANSIRSSIRDSRPEMIEAISPIMAAMLGDCLPSAATSTNRPHPVSVYSPVAICCTPSPSDVATPKIVPNTARMSAA